MRKNRSILMKMLAGISIPVFIVLFIAAALILVTMRNSTEKLLERELEAKSKVAAMDADKFFSQYVEITKQLAANYEVELIMKDVSGDQRIPQHKDYTNMKHTLDNAAASDKENILACWLGDFDSSQLSQSDGYTSPIGWDITKRPWYAVGETKKSLLTPPYIDASTSKLIVSASSPVSNSQTGDIIGATGVDITIDHLGDIFKQYSIGENGFVIVCSNNGQVIYHPNLEYCNKSIDEVGLSENIVSAIKEKKTGNYLYSLADENMYGYLSLVGDKGWTVISGLSASEYNSSLIYNAKMISTIFIIGLLLVMMVVIFASNSITKPIKKIAKAAYGIAEGNLDVDLDVHSNDEIGQLSQAFKKTILRLKDYIKYIDEVSYSLDQISSGNLVFELKYKYEGEFEKIKISLTSLRDMLVKILSDIGSTATQVSLGAQQVSQGAQSLSQGSSEQAEAVERLASAIAYVSGQVSHNAESVSTANTMFGEMNEKVEESNKKMLLLNSAMQDINEASEKISRIIKTIENISFQTNILALNASVEASRAGVSGKGFSVVANEVRSLASRSSNAAKETEELIASSVNAVKKGNRIAEDTTITLSDVVRVCNEVSGIVEKISKATTQQEESITQITTGVEKISAVVQTNSATADQSASSSEQLSNQSNVLRGLTDRFKLSGNSAEPPKRLNESHKAYYDNQLNEKY